jgi:hypothetical protein
LRLRHADVDFKAATAHVRQGKNGEERLLPLVPAVLAEIKRLGKGEADQLVVESIRKPGRPMSTPPSCAAAYFGSTGGWPCAMLPSRGASLLPLRQIIPSSDAPNRPRDSKQQDEEANNLQ